MDNNDVRTGLEIAVIGMAGRFPAAKNIHEFWNNLKDGVESISFLNDEELVESGLSESALKNPRYVKAQGGILEDREYFDASFFGYLPSETRIMDPQVRFFHECAWEALEDSGYDSDGYAGLIGIYSGAGDHFYWEALAHITATKELLDTQAVLQLSDKDFLTTRVSFKLNLKGPAITIQTACSTSLVAVDQACRGLLSGLCDMALAGGVTVSSRKNTGYVHREGSIHSADGHCRPFDKNATGTIFGEGAAIVVLKRLEEAIADGDHIYCVIRGFAVNNDGIRKASYTAPSIEGQAHVIRAALQMAEVEPESIGYVETHGTATELGDSVEIEGLKLAFSTEKRNYCAIGSVKANTGHLDAAAGTTGFIKTALILKHRLIPPSINFEAPNPKIDLKNSPFFVNVELREWKRDQYPLRCGVSSFGIGGTNAHVVLEEAPQSVIGNQSLVIGKEGQNQLILLSAKTQSALEKMTINLKNYFKGNPDINFADAAYTLQVGRRDFNHRKMLVCSTVDEAITTLSIGDPKKIKTSLAQENDRYVVFMFPGQGAQYVNMGWHLYQNEPLFRQEMDHCFEILKDLVNYNLKEILYPGISVSEVSDENTIMSTINQTEIAQQVLFIFEYSLAKLLLNWGIKPDAIIGYSFGEYLAACLSGVFSLEDALKIIIIRGQLIKQLPPGAMLSVPLTEEELKPLIGDELSIGIDNGPSCIVSGPLDAIDHFEKQMKKKRCMCMRLDNPHALHSRMMEPVLKEFQAQVARIPVKKPKIPYISNVTGDWITVEEATDHRYWTKHLRETIRFSDGIKKLLEKDNPLFIEVGPGNALSTMVRGNKDKEAEGLIINIIRHPAEKTADDVYLLNKIGQLWLWGISIDWEAYYASQGRRRISLPTYPFQRKRYWIDGDLFRLGAEMLSRVSPVRKTDIGDWFYVPLWEQTMPAHTGTTPTTGPIQSVNWLVFMDETGLGTRLVQRLEQEGHRVVTVTAGETFIKGNNHGNAYVVNPGQADTYQQLFRELQGLRCFPDRVLHLWNVHRVNVNSDNGDPSLENLDETQDIGFYSLLNIVQAVGRQAITDKLQISVVTTNMQQVTGEEIISPEKATILAAVKIIPLEYINISCRSIDIQLPGTGSHLEDRLVDLLLEELHTNSQDKFVAFRGVSRWIPTWKPHHLMPPQEMGRFLKKEGVYLITGGFGGMGFTFAQYLAKSYQARLMLIGRSPFPPRHQWDEWLNTHDPDDQVSLNIRKIRECEEKGGIIMAACADVSDYYWMREIISDVKKRFGQINGVLHTAGLVDHAGVIQRRTREMSEKVMAAKLRGTLVLDALLKDENLDFFVLCSSVGNVLYKMKFGEVAYVAGNEFLEAFANYKFSASNSNTHTVAVNWTDWFEVGMAVDVIRAQTGVKAEDINYDHFFDGVTPAEGVEILQRVLTNKCHHLTIATKELDLLIEQFFSSGSEKPPLSEPGEIEDTLPEADLDERPRLTTQYVAPKREVEQKLAKLFQHYFGIEKVGIHDDFFELGGDSFKALNIAAKIHQLLHVEINLPVFFSNPTIAGLADYINKKNKSEFFTVMPAEKKEYYLLSSTQTRFYILQQVEADNTIFNMARIMMLGDSPQLERLDDVFRTLIRRHESLRTSFMDIEGSPVQVIHEDVGFEMEVYDLQNRTDEPKVDLKTTIRGFVRPFDLCQAPLLRAALIRTAAGDHILLIDMHHMVSDIVSLGVLKKDFTALYNCKILEPLRLQYKDYCQWQEDNQRKEEIKHQKAYWLKEFAGKIPVIHLPTDFPRPEIQSFDGWTLKFNLGNEETQELKKIASEQGATLFMVFLALQNIWLWKLCGQEDIVIGAPLAGRNHADLEKMIGVFLKTLALRNFPSGKQSFIEFLNEVKSRTLRAFENQDYSFEDLVESLNLPRDMSRNPLFDVALNFHIIDVKAAAKDITESVASIDSTNTGEVHIHPDEIPEEYGGDIAYNDLTWYVEENADGLDLSIEYCTKLFKRETIERFIKYFHEIVTFVTEKKNCMLEDIIISHDLIQSQSGILEEELEDFDF